MISFRRSTHPQQQGAFSEKDEQLRQILAKLDASDPSASLTADDLTAIRRQLAEGQSLVRETIDRLRQSQEENEMITRRRDELESRVATLEADYEELLGTIFPHIPSFIQLTIPSFYREDHS